MRAAAHEYRNVAVGVFVQGSRYQSGNSRRLRVFVVPQAGVYRHRIASQRPLVGHRSREPDLGFDEVFYSRHDLAKSLVKPLDQALLRAKIGAQNHRFQRYPATIQPVTRALHEQGDFRFAKPVYRLHRIADQEHGAAVARLPSGSQQFEHLHLFERRVLELIDQDMPNPVVQKQGEIGRLFGLSQGVQGRDRDFRIIHFATLGKNQL
ncbi:hypothetical protein MnTg04_00945 [bacterium MnTg04]|nr:hypothetical protein MnTg04_00945 [bacterium MnTg04]